MSEQIKDGGPAFPVIRDDEMQNTAWGGMTLRDYFAAKAMQALIGSRRADYEDGFYDEDRVARNAYLMADVMLEAREVKS